MEPTKLTALTSLLFKIASTASLSPLMTLKTPSGKPASFKSSANFIEQEGSFSEGLSTNVFPQAIAIGNIHMGTIAGKLKGVIPATTPRGWRIDQLSTLVPTFSENSPFNKCGIPQANSTTSNPRVSDPLASSKTFPCSATIIFVNSSEFFSINSLNLNITLALCKEGFIDQSPKAFFAISTALSKSDFEANITSACCSPVAGLKTLPFFFDEPGIIFPSTKCSIIFMNMIF